MIKTIRNLLVLSACTILLLLCGCQSTGISLSQMKNDVIASDVIQNCYHSDYTYESPYSMVDLTIVKEQNNSENKEIITYSDAKIKNDFFEIDLSIQSIYNYYDKGGWILDELYVENINNVTPLRGPSEDLASSMILEYADNEVLHSCFLDNPEEELALDLWFDESGIYSTGESILCDDGSSAKIKGQFNSKIATYSGYFLFDFSSETGWVCQEPKLYVEEWATDFSATLGTFTATSNIYTTYGDLTVPNITFEIISIEDNVVTYSIKGQRESMPGNYQIGNNLTAEYKLDEYGLRFKFGEFSSGYGMWLEYVPENDMWSYDLFDFARE